MKVLVIGYGSIGKRRARILQEMGHEVFVEDIKDVPKRLVPKDDYYEMVDAIFVCTPPSTHFLLAGLWNEKRLFVEKSLVVNKGQLEELGKIPFDKTTMVACNMRFEPAIKEAYRMINEDWIIGDVLSVKVDFGYYLPYWRPDIDYKTVEHPGVLLDCIHEFDLLEWFHWPIVRIVDGIGHRFKSNPPFDLPEGSISIIDMLVVLGEGENHISANIHLDYLRKEKKREIR